MIFSLAHLSVHSQVLYTSVDEAVETNIVEEFEHKSDLQETTKAEIHKSLEAGTSAQETVVDFWNYLNKLTVEHGQELEGERLKLQKITSSKSNRAKKNREINRLLDSTTSLVSQYTDRISTSLPEYRCNVGKYVEAYSKFAFWFASADKSEEVQGQELYKALRNFKETSESLIGSMSEFVDNVKGLGRTALEDSGHTGLNNACMKLVGKLVGTLGTVRELNTFTEDMLKKLSLRE